MSSVAKKAPKRQKPSGHRRNSAADDIAYTFSPDTPLAVLAIKCRKKLLEAGTPLLDAEGILKEVSERRGEKRS